MVISNFEIVGLKDLSSLVPNEKKVKKAASQALNRTADRARAESAREVLRQLRLPPNYVKAKDSKRLRVKKRAKQEQLEAVVAGQKRPTSLARFSTAINKKGVSVAVKPGAAKFIPNAFLIKLKAGNADLDTRANFGLAVRTKKNKIPSKAYKPKKLGPNLWLLYGPSVGQAFGGKDGIAKKVSPDTAKFLEKEFNRLVRL
jgi:hypothetical protein